MKKNSNSDSKKNDLINSESESQKEKKRLEEKRKEEENMDSAMEKEESSFDHAKSHGEILKEQIVDGQATYNKNPISLLLSSFTAGLEIGFSYLLICTLFFFLDGKLAEDTIFKLMSFVYPVGFIMIIGGQSILFTEQTSLLALPVLNNKRSIGSLIRTWSIVIVGNLIGGCLMAALLVWFGPKLGIFELSQVEIIAVHVSDVEPLVILVSAILAGWLMGLLSWLVAASKESVSRIIVVYLITAVLAFAGLHHSIVGNVEVFAGLISSEKITWAHYLSFEGIALLGNAIGGVVFVALLKYRAFVYDVKG